MDDLSAGLTNRRERDERAGRARPRFFLDLTSGRSQCFFVWLDLTLRNRPGSLVFPCPQRAARMDEQYLERPDNSPE